MWTSLFHIDALSIVMMSLVGFIGAVIASFAKRYLQGDVKYHQFFILLSLLIASIMVMVCADHVLLFAAMWLISNLLLARLMIHKKSWKAAYASGKLAAKNFLIGYSAIVCGLFLLCMGSSALSIQNILHSSINPVLLFPGLGLLLIGAMTQSAIWPFHRWLISSLNSPTPVSALMHAGLINGGGFLLARFAHLYLKVPSFLLVIFLLGLFSALVGTVWKMMQQDVKRMLAFSTMSQMGFMFVQCGLGLFPAALAHLCWHGMFKAYLFLGSANVAKQKKININKPISISAFLLAVICGFVGAMTFSYVSYGQIFPMNTAILLNVVALIAGAQFALTFLRARLKNIFIALISTIIMGAIYGLNVRLIKVGVTSLGFMQPQDLQLIHIIGVGTLAAFWLIFTLGAHKYKNTKFFNRAYVKMLNASQPSPETITANRNQYQYI